MGLKMSPTFVMRMCANLLISFLSWRLDFFLSTTDLVNDGPVALAGGALTAGLIQSTPTGHPSSSCPGNFVAG